MRIDGAASGSEVASGFRASEVHGVVSMHPADGGGGPLEITPPSAVCGGSAPIARPHPGVAWGQGSELKLGLLGGADRPPQPAAPELDFHAAYRRLRHLHNHYNRLSRTDIVRDFRSAMRRASGNLVRLFESFGGRVENLGSPSSGVTTADRAHLVLQEMAGQADRDGDLARAGAIRTALEAIDKQTVEELQALCGNYDSATAPSTQAMQRPPMTAGAAVTVAAIPPQARPPRQFDWISAYGQLRGLANHFSAIDRNVAARDVRAAADRMSKAVMYRFRKFVGDPEHLLPRSGSLTKPERAYRALGDMSRRASESDNASWAYVIRQSLEDLGHSATNDWDEVTAKYGAPDALFTQVTRTSHASDSSTMDSMRAMQAIPAMQLLPARVGPTTSVALPVTVTPPVTGGAARMPVSALDPDSVGHLVQVPGAPGPPPASSLPGPSLCEAAGARAGDLGRRRFDPPATAPGATAVEPLATEATVTPSLAGTSSFWLQPADPVAAQGSVPFDAGLHHTGETVQPPPVTTTPSSTAPAPGAAYPVPSWPDDGLAVERALLAGELPPRFDAPRLIAEAGMFADFGLAQHLVAGLLPLHTIDRLIEAIQTTDKRGRNALYIECLPSVKESIERVARAAPPGRVDREWLDQVRELLRLRDELAARSAASATDLAEFDVTEIDRLLRTGEGASHPPPLPPASAPGHTGAGAGAPPPAADPWRIRPPGMSDGPRPVAVDPWSAPPGPSSQVVYTEAMRTPVLSTGAPPGWPGAGPPGFARAASGAVELPFSHRQEIARRFSTEDALLEAELALQTGGAGALGWSSTRWRAVLADLYRLHHAIVRSDSAAAAARIDVDWSAIEALVPILDVSPPSP